MNRDYSLLRRQNPIPVYLQRHGVRMLNGKFACVSPDHDDHNPSASIYDSDEKWKCHACDIGGDIIDLCMLHKGLSHAEAVTYLGGDDWQAPPQPPPKKGSKPQLVRDYGPPPDDTPLPKVPKVTLLKKSGEGTYTKQADAIYPYRDRDGHLQACVCRIDNATGKEIYPIRWHLTAQAWTQAGFTKDERRPLFNEDLIHARPGDEILIVEGEKCARIAEALFPDMVVVTWIGGTSNVSNTDFSSLKGRHVTLWRDNDQPGLKAMEEVARLAQGATTMTVPIGNDWQDGWDVADVAASAPGAAHEALDRRRIHKPDCAPKGRLGAWATKADGGWVPDDIPLTLGPTQQIEVRNSFNIQVALKYHPAFSTLMFCTVRREIYFQGRILLPQAMAHLAGLLNSHTGLIAAREFTADVELIALARPFNSLQLALEKLTWDKVERLSRMPGYLNLDPTPWHRAAVQRWFLGLVQRILAPGSKADLVLILEGEQGIGKSTALEIIGRGLDGYNGYAMLTTLGAGTFKPGDNGLMFFAGKTVIELGEMSAYSSASLERFKALVSSSHDRYRTPYAKFEIDVPRTVSLAGTTNAVTGYLNDPTGARRFVPVACRGEIFLDELQADVEQLYAEAVYRLKGGALPYFTEEEEALQDEAVEARRVISFLEHKLSELTETEEQRGVEFIPMHVVLGHLKMDTDHAVALVIRQDADIKKTMATLGWSYGRCTVGDERPRGFLRGEVKRGRPKKRQLFPRI